HSMSIAIRFYIDKFSSEGDHGAVRTHMRILSVVRIKVFSMYRYNYMKKIILHRADLKEYVIAERDFKYMYPSDFEDMYLLNLQGHLNHLSPDDKKIDKALDYRVKEFRVNKTNPGMNTRFWTKKDVSTLRCFDTENRQVWSECLMVYTSDDSVILILISCQGILLKMNLPDHRGRSHGSAVNPT
ncbi:hypothetical protein Tco_0775586, partial [Tanacetum coccineum]